MWKELKSSIQTSVMGDNAVSGINEMSFSPFRGTEGLFVS